MKDHIKEPVTDPITEARRYVENAQSILNEKGKLNVETHHYRDRKYVRAAGHFLWSGVLIALEGVFHLKTARHKRIHIEEYKSAATQRDKKLLDWINDGYEVMHLNMGYDGVLSKPSCDDGFRLANSIIDRCAALLPSQGGALG